jgi:hypothetical protein
MKHLKNMIAIALMYPLLVFCEDRESFSKWWETHSKERESLPKELVTMVNYCVEHSLFEKEVTEYWSHISKFNIVNLEDQGYNDFKSNITKNYYIWITSKDHQYAQKLDRLVKKKFVRLPKEELLRMQPGMSYKDSQQFNKVTELFINYIYKLKEDDTLSQLEEPLTGNPCYVKFQDKRVSQDVLYSVLELHSLKQGCDVVSLDRIYEIGAGSGRTAHTILSLYPSIKYVIVDIAPALYVSQTYLSDVFPDKKIMKFRAFGDFKEVEEEYRASDVVFLTPDQLRMLPEQGESSLFMAINCFTEFSNESVNGYLKEADRLSRYVYFNTWKRARLAKDLFYTDTDSFKPIESWKEVYKRPYTISPDFFEAFYITNK